MSVASDISAAIATAVRALSFVPNASVVERKVPTLPEGEEPPQIVVTVLEEGLTIYADFEGNVLVIYPAAVTIITGAGSKQANDATIRTWRETIRKTVDNRATFATVAAFHNVTSEGRVPFNPAALAKDLNYSVQLFSVVALESRN